MAFGEMMALANVGLSAFGALSSNRRASSADRLARDQLSFERDLANRLLPFQTGGLQAGLDSGEFLESISRMMLSRTNDATATEQRIRDYLFTRNETNDGLALQNRDYQRRVAEQNLMRQLEAAGLNYEEQVALRDRLLARQENVDELAREDHNISLADRQRLLNSAQLMREGLNEATQGMGTMAPARRFTEADVRREGDIRVEEARRSVDRAAQIAASANEAALISSGIDASSTGAARRAEVAGRIAPLYEEAFRRARDSGLGYIRGVQQTEAEGQASEIARRRAVLDEIINSALAPLNIEMRLPNVAPGMGRELNIGAPTMTPGVQQIPSDSGINNAFQRIDYTNPLQFLAAAAQSAGGAGNIFTSIGGQRTQPGAAVGFSNNATERAGQAFGSFGTALSDWTNRGGADRLWDRVSGWFGSGGQGTINPSTGVYNPLEGRGF